MIRFATARPDIGKNGGVGPGRVFGGISVSSDKIIIRPDGTIIRIPPRSPLLGILFHIELHSQAED